MDKLRTPSDLAGEFKRLHHQRGLTGVELAKRAGRSRDILHRLEQNGEVSVAALMDFLRASGLAMQLVNAGLPTAQEMRQKFAEDGETDEGGDGDTA